MPDLKGYADPDYEKGAPDTDYEKNDLDHYYQKNEAEKMALSEGVLPTAPSAVTMLPIDPSCPADPRYESQWAQEMAADGCTDIPVSWYRQTPWNAVSRKHGRLFITCTTLLSFGLNTGIGFASLKGNDQVGLWQKPPKSEYPDRYRSVAITDLILTIVVPVLIAIIFARRAGLRALKKGWTVPIDPHRMEAGLWSVFPMHLNNRIRRGLRMMLLSLIFCGVPFVVVLEIFCATGGMNGKNSTCSFNVLPYVFIRSTWAAIVHGCIIAPVVLFTGLSAALIKPADQAIILANQRERWAAQNQHLQQQQKMTSNGDVGPA